MTPEEIKNKLAKLKQYILDENISYGEIAELQSLAKHIDKEDTLLLQWAGVPEFPEDNSISFQSKRFNVEVKENTEGIIIDIYDNAKEGELIQSYTYWNEC